MLFFLHPTELKLHEILITHEKKEHMLKNTVKLYLVPCIDYLNKSPNGKLPKNRKNNNYHVVEQY